MRAPPKEFFIPVESTKPCPTCDGTGEVPCIKRKHQTSIPEGIGMVMLAIVNWDEEKRFIRPNWGYNWQGILEKNVSHALNQARDFLKDVGGRRRFLKALFKQDDDEGVDEADQQMEAALVKLEALLIIALEQKTDVHFDTREAGEEHAEDRHGHSPQHR